MDTHNIAYRKFFSKKNNGWALVTERTYDCPIDRVEQQGVTMTLKGEWSTEELQFSVLFTDGQSSSDRLREYETICEELEVIRTACNVMQDAVADNFARLELEANEERRHEEEETRRTSNDNLEGGYDTDVPF